MKNFIKNMLYNAVTMNMNTARIVGIIASLWIAVVLITFAPLWTWVITIPAWIAIEVALISIFNHQQKITAIPLTL